MATLTKLELMAKNLEGFWLTEGRSVPASGAYALILELGCPVIFTTGRHGKVRLGPGRYLYAGRARRALPARITRHCRQRKTLHWHIDHLTTRTTSRILSILIIPERPDVECQIIRECLLLPDTQVPLTHFGCGDCKEGCPSHLVRLA